MAIIIGDASRNTLAGTSGDDTTESRDGNDWLYGFDGNDALYGGSGNDQIGDDDLFDSVQSGDSFFGGDGNDILSRGGGGHEGTGATDWLYGGSGRDRIVVTGNRDLVIVDGGDDGDIIEFYWEEGDPRDPADDSALGAATLLGGAGNDSITGESLRGLRIDAGSGDDVVWLFAPPSGQPFVAPRQAVDGGAG